MSGNLGRIEKTFCKILLKFWKTKLHPIFRWVSCSLSYSLPYLPEAYRAGKEGEYGGGKWGGQGGGGQDEGGQERRGDRGGQYEREQEERHQDKRGDTRCQNGRGQVVRHKI